MFKKSLSFALLFTFVSTFSHISFAAEVLEFPSSFMNDFIHAEIEDMFKEGEEEEEEESSEDSNSEGIGQEYESEEEEEEESSESHSSDQESAMALFWKDVENNFLF